MFSTTSAVPPFGTWFPVLVLRNHVVSATLVDNNFVQVVEKGFLGTDDPVTNLYHDRHQNIPARGLALQNIKRKLALQTHCQGCSKHDKLSWVVVVFRVFGGTLFQVKEALATLVLDLKVVLGIGAFEVLMLVDVFDTLLATVAPKGIAGRTMELSFDGFDDLDWIGFGSEGLGCVGTLYAFKLWSRVFLLLVGGGVGIFVRHGVLVLAVVKLWAFRHEWQPSCNCSLTLLPGLHTHSPVLYCHSRGFSMDT